MSTTLQLPGIDLSVDILAMSSALGGETSDTVVSSYTALGKVRDIAVLGLVTNVAEGSIVTMLVQTASDSSGTGVTTLTGKTETVVATATGTATATLKIVTVCEQNNIPAGHTHIRARLTTDNASGTEVVALLLLRKVNAQN